MMKKKSIIIGLVLLAVSIIPIFLMVREIVVSNYVLDRYEITSVEDKHGYPTGLDSQIIEVSGHVIEILEEPTGEKEQLQPLEMELGEIPRDIVLAQIVVDGEEIGKPYEIKLAAREDQTRYHNYIDIVSVKETGHERLAIIVTKQMFTVGSPGQWDIIWIDGDDVSVESFKLRDRGNQLLATRLVNYAGLAEMSFGYYSDINYIYPSLAFPIIYPAGTVLAGIILLLYGVISYFVKRDHENV